MRAKRQQGLVSVSPNVGWKRGAFSGLNYMKVDGK